MSDSQPSPISPTITKATYCLWRHLRHLDESACLIACATALSLTPLLLSRFLPFHDYPNGVFQGYLLRLVRYDPAGVSRFYEWVKSPVPYSAWAMVSWALGYLVASPELVAKLFFALTTLFFVGGAAYLIRSVQGRPTGLELLPLVWVYDRFVWDGVLNYHMALGLCLLTVGYLHRATGGGQRAPDRRAMVVLSLLSIATYLSHILGWAPLCLAVAVYGYHISRRQGAVRGLRTLGFLLPSAVLLLWYVSGRGGGVSWVLYPSLAIKLYSWASVPLLFFRLEPFGLQPPLPFILNLLALAAVLALIAMQARWQQSRPRRLSLSGAAALSAAACLICAILIPFYLFANMGPPDARFLQPSFWLAVASVRYQPRTLRNVTLVLALAGLVLIVNLTQFVRVAPLLEEVYRTTDAVIPPTARVYSVSVRTAPASVAGALGGTTIANFTVGMPILDYFDLYRFMARCQYHARLGMFGVGLVMERQSDSAPQLEFDVLAADDPRQTADALRVRASEFDFVELVGKMDYLDRVTLFLAPDWRSVARGPGVLVLSR